MKPKVDCLNSLALLIRLTILLAFAPLVLVDGQARAQERPRPKLAEQYRKRVEQRQAEMRSGREDVKNIDDTIRALRKEIAAEGRRGRIKDLRSRIDHLNERKETLNKRIERERQAISGAAEPDEALRRVSASDLIEQQKQRAQAISDLDGQIAALKRQLVKQGGRKGRRSNLQKQIEELTGKRNELASRPRVDPEDATDAAAVENALARRFSEAEARRKDQLKNVRARIDDLQKKLASEGRRARRQSTESMIAELKLKERELQVAPPPAGGEEPRQAIERAFKREREDQERRAEGLDHKINMLRRQLRTEGRAARRKSVNLQIQELQRQKSGKPQKGFQPPPKKGFTGAPYGSAWDLDAEYKPSATSE